LLKKGINRKNIPAKRNKISEADRGVFGGNPEDRWKHTRKYTDTIQDRIAKSHVGKFLVSISFLF
jgi:hypothetical protein